MRSGRKGVGVSVVRALLAAALSFAGISHLSAASNTTHEATVGSANEHGLQILREIEGGFDPSMCARTPRDASSAARLVRDENYQQLCACS